MSGIELKPCQRCGSKKLSIEFDELFDEPFYVLCKKCGAKSAMCETEEIAIENWNTRPIEDGLRERADRLEKIVEELFMRIYRIFGYKIGTDVEDKPVTVISELKLGCNQHLIRIVDMKKEWEGKDD